MTEDDCLLMDEKIEFLAGIINELCDLLGIDVGTKTDAQVCDELVERCKRLAGEDE